MYRANFFFNKTEHKVSLFKKLIWRLGNINSVNYFSPSMHEALGLIGTTAKQKKTKLTKGSSYTSGK